MKKSKSLALSILVTLFASSVTANKLQQVSKIRGCIAHIGVAQPNCDEQCKYLYPNPGEEPSGTIEKLGESPPLCFCFYKCGGPISNTCRVLTGSLIKDDKNVDKKCDETCKNNFLNGKRRVSKFLFGNICECDYDC